MWTTTRPSPNTGRPRPAQDVTIKQSHGGSGKQARSVIDGLDADVVTLALAGDIDALASHGGLIPKDWQKRLPHNSAPYTSTIVFLVRKGNPKGIKDWDDLDQARRGRDHAESQDLGRRALELPGRLGVRQAQVRQRCQGQRIRRQAVQERARARHRRARLDHHLRAARRWATCCWPGRTRPSWRSRSSAPTNSRSSCPRISILAEPTVTVVDKNVDKKGTRAVARLTWSTCTPTKARTSPARNYYRPTSDKARAKYASQFPKLTLFNIDQAFGGWGKADQAHFADGANFDQIYSPK